MDFRVIGLHWEGADNEKDDRRNGRGGGHDAVCGWMRVERTACAEAETGRAGAGPCAEDAATGKVVTQAGSNRSESVQSRRNVSA